MSKRKGFTLVEVTLFLAITALLFLGIAMGVQNSVFQQRYNDSTQSFLEVMRSIYSEVSNPQTVGTGNSEQAIYGKLIVFGESKMLDGATNNSDAIFVYDVIGGADTVGGGLGSGTVQDMLKNLNATIVRVTSTDASNNVTGADFVAAEKYTPHWGASIDGLTNGTPFTGSILVVRHPRAGTINTLFYNQVLDANAILKDARDSANFNGIVNLIKNNIYYYQLPLYL